MPSGEIPLGYRIGASGADETLQKLKALHEEVRQGTISARNYTKEHRELTLAGRASAQQFNDIKGAINAANPNLMELTKTMSIFSGVANVGMSALNSINLALLQGSSAAQSLSAQYQKNANDYNEFIRLYESPQYGPGSPNTEAAYQKYQADLNTTSNLQKQLGVASIDTGISVGLSAISMIGSMAQAYTAIKAIQWDRVFAAISASALGAQAAIVTFASTVLMPLAVVVAGIELINFAFALLPGQIGDNVKAIQQRIESDWNVSAIEALMISPFVQFAGGIVTYLDEIYNNFASIFNAITDNIVNPIVAVWNNTLGLALGKIESLSDAQYKKTDPNSVLNQLGLGLSNGGPSSAIQNFLQGNPSQNTSTNPNNYDPTNTLLSANPWGSTSTTGGLPTPSTDQPGAETASQVMQGLQSLVEPSNKTATNSTQQSQLLSGINAGTTQTNQTLTTINSGIAALVQPLTNQTAAAANLKTTMDANLASINQTILDLQNQKTTLQAQPQTVQTGSQWEATGGEGAVFGTELVPTYGPSAAATQLASITKQITSLQQQATSLQSQSNVLDNATSGLGAVLVSIGQDSSGTTGIGSIISSALGGYAGQGGAGINAQQLAYFAQTGDYGVFTQAANQDFANQSAAPSQAQQIQAWMNATGINNASLAAQALGYASGASSGASNTGNGQYGGLPGQYGNPSTEQSALGNFQGPTGQVGKTISVQVVNNIAGTLASQQDLNNTISDSVKNALLGVGWG